MLNKDIFCLQAIAEAIQRIEEYTANYNDGDGLYNNTIAFDAVLMNFVVIGEMVGKLSNQLKDKHSQIDWQLIKNFRNLIAHNYFGVDAEEIWDIIKTDLPKLKRGLNDYFHV